MNKLIKQIITEICKEKNIKYTFLSKEWILMLEKGNKTKFITGYKFDLNSHASGLIVDDKYATYEVLKAKNIPVSEYNIVYNYDNNFDYAKGCNSQRYVEDYFFIMIKI